jgi:hypothetical protein
MRLLSLLKSNNANSSRKSRRFPQQVIQAYANPPQNAKDNFRAFYRRSHQSLLGSAYRHREASSPINYIIEYSGVKNNLYGNVAHGMGV